MAAPPGWDYYETDIHMRFDHWVSPDGQNNWTHSSKIYESSGVFDGTDRRGSTWAPMATFDRATDRWHLFYVAYRASPAYRTPLGLYRDPKTGKPQALHLCGWPLLALRPPEPWRELIVSVVGCNCRQLHAI